MSAPHQRSTQGLARDCGLEVYRSMHSQEREVTTEVLAAALWLIIWDDPDPKGHYGPATKRLRNFMKLCVREGI